MTTTPTVGTGLSRFLTRCASWNEKVVDWVVPIAGVGAFVCAALVGASLWWLIPGVVFAGIAAFSQIVQNSWIKRQRDHDKQQAAAELKAAKTQALNEFKDAEERWQQVYDEALEDHSVLADQLDPISRNVAGMADLDAAGRKDVFGRVAVQTVNAIMLAYLRILGLRAVIYEVSDDDQSMNVVEWTSLGHRLQPNPFLRNTSRGQKAFDLVKAGEALFVDDVANAPKDKWEGSGNGYNTFISCPITSPTSSYGLLTVDAVNTDDLTEQNVNDLRLVASILAPAFAEYRRKD